MEKLLKNLKTFLDFLPEGYVEKLDIDIEAEMVSEDQRKKIINFGRTAYPYVYAYVKVFDDCCRIKEEAGIHNFIKDNDTRRRFDKFIREGGEVEQIRQGKMDEEYLSEDDVKAFVSAEREVHKEVHREVRERIEGMDKEKFNEYVKEGKEKVERIDSGINKLLQMASELPEHTAEINQKIEEMENRWVNYGNQPQEADLNELFEYYSSIIEV